MIEALVDLARAAGECDYLDDRNALLDALEAELDAIHPRLRQRVLERLEEESIFSLRLRLVDRGVWP